MAVAEAYGTRRNGRVAATGAAAQLLLLALLGTAARLGPAGWLAGVAFAAGAPALLVRALHRSRSRSLGPADRVTLARATLVGCVTALVADTLTRPPQTAVLTGLAAVALILDAFDGRVARRTGTASELGARFDMEVDAFLILVLAVLVAGSLGAWVLLTGAMRYAFVLAARPLPWLRGELPPSTARKTVAAVQGTVLLAAGAGVLPRPVAYGAVLLALVLLLWSFGRDVGGLWRVRERRTAGTPRDAPRANA